MWGVRGGGWTFGLLACPALSLPFTRFPETNKLSVAVL